MSKKVPSFGLAILLFYLLIRIGFDSFWRTLTPYAAYGFELVFVGLVWSLYQKRIRFFSFSKNQLLIDFLIPLFLGFSVFKFSGFLGIPVPFNLNGIEVVLLLLVVAPILEELIFRMALWEAIKDLTQNKIALIASSSLLFSLGHFIAFWGVPEQYRSFVVYQTLYVIILGLGASFRRHETNSISAGIFVHFSFNFGFYLASQF